MLYFFGRTTDLLDRRRGVFLKYIWTTKLFGISSKHIFEVWLIFTIEFLWQHGRGGIIVLDVNCIPVKDSIRLGIHKHQLRDLIMSCNLPKRQ